MVIALLAALSFNVLAKNDYLISDEIISKYDAISDDFVLAVNLSVENGICNDAFTQFAFLDGSMKASLECLKKDNLSDAASHAANAKAWATALKANPDINIFYGRYFNEKKIDEKIDAIDVVLKILRVPEERVFAKVRKIESSTQGSKVGTS